jgi:uncharacterized protein (DUF427 family)
MALYLEPTPKRIRGEVGGATIADSRRALILQESGLQPVYYFPPEDVRRGVLEPSERRTRCPKKGEASYYTIHAGGKRVENGAWTYPDPIAGAPPIKDLIAFYWDRVDHWFEEGEEVFVHPRDPYHRIDILSSDRHVRVLLDGEVLADSRRAVALFESNLPPRWYLPAEDVGVGLQASLTVTRCPYKGTAAYFSAAGVEDLIWYYADPLPERPESGAFCASSTSASTSSSTARSSQDHAACLRRSRRMTCRRAASRRARSSIRCHVMRTVTCPAASVLASRSRSLSNDSRLE